MGNSRVYWLGKRPENCDPQKKIYILISHLDIIREPAISLIQYQLAYHLLKLLSKP